MGGDSQHSSHTLQLDYANPRLFYHTAQYQRSRDSLRLLRGRELISMTQAQEERGVPEQAPNHFLSHLVKLESSGAPLRNNSSEAADARAMREVPKG